MNSNKEQYHQNQLSLKFATDYGLSEKLFFYWKGRVGLYALLKAMGIKEGDEVILPAFTCVVVPNAIIYLGAKPVYVDILESTYNMDVEKVEAAITGRTKVIICQNTYGLSTDLCELNDLAKRYDLYTIEDCTHGFGGTYNGVANGLSCDAAFYSTQWNKPFSTGIGGFVVTSSSEISVKLSQLEKEKLPPSAKDTLSLKVLYFVRRYLINDSTYWPLVNLYRFLSKRNLVLGSSSGKEITSVDMPEAFFKGFSEVQAKEGVRNIAELPQSLIARKDSAKEYTHLLQNHGKRHVDENLFANHSFLKYPILVKDRNLFLELAEKSKIEMGEWFISPLHPIEGDLTPWYLDEALYPVASFVSKHMVNLPTTPKNIDRVIDFVEANIEMVM